MCIKEVQNAVGIKHKTEILVSEFFLTYSCIPWHASVCYSGHGTSCSVQLPAFLAQCSAKPCYSAWRTPPRWGWQMSMPLGSRWWLLLLPGFACTTVLHRASLSPRHMWLDASSRLAVTGGSIWASQQPTVCQKTSRLLIPGYELDDKVPGLMYMMYLVAFHQQTAGLNGN